MLKVGDAIRIVRGDEDKDLFCTDDSWYIQQHIHKLNEKGYYPGPTYYLYKDYEGAVGVILKMKRNTVYSFDFYIVLIGSKKIQCLESVMKQINA